VSADVISRNGAGRYAGIGMLLALALAGMLGACDDGPPTRPSRPTPPTGPPPPAPVTLVRLELTGPGTVPPGESAQYSVNAYWSDGSVRDLTREAEWRSSDASVLSISPTGVATGQARGSTFISVGAAGSFSSKEVIVLPAGSYRLTGNVRDTGFGVTGARVEVTAGTGRGLAATTSTGGYVLFGVGGDVEVRVTGDGFQEQRKRLLVTTHQQLDFDLIVSEPRPEVSGTYSLTVSADPACRAALPEEARARTYTAIVQQTGPHLRVTLEGSTFYTGEGGGLRNTFAGAIDRTGITFLLDPVQGYYYRFPVPAVLEVLSPEMYFQISGSARTTIAPGSLSGTLSGGVEIVRPTTPSRFETIAYCASDRHQFVLTR
jgi:hypothetical protein